MTEQEAIEKECILMRMTAGIHCISTNCIGSKCFTGWRYYNPEFVKGNKYDKKLSGYCGIGGKEK